MTYDYELGLVGNLKKALSELNKTNQDVFDTKHEINIVADNSASWNDIAAAITEGVNDVE